MYLFTLLLIMLFYVGVFTSILATYTLHCCYLLELRKFFGEADEWLHFLSAS